MGHDYSSYGTGSVGENCMEYHMTGKCEHGHEEIGPTPCKERTCPQCAESVHIEPKVVEIGARLITALLRGLGEQIVFLRAKPEVAKLGVNGYFGRRGRAHEIAEKAGLVGGVCLAQPNNGEDPSFLYIGLTDGINWEDSHSRWSVTVENNFGSFDWERDRKGYRPLIEAVKEQVEQVQWPTGSQKKVFSWIREMAGGKFNTKGGCLNRERRRIEELTGYEGDSVYDGKSVELPVRGSESVSECPVDSCSGAFYQIHNFNLLLERASFGQYEYFRTLIAYQWFCGLIEPPPRLISPSSEAEYEELLEALLEQEGYPTAPRNPLPAEVQEKASAS